MKKYSLLIALALLSGGVSLLPLNVNAQDDKQGELEREWYDACQTKKDDRCLPLSKELLEKYPTSQYAKFAKAKIQNDSVSKLSDKFQAALKAYYAGPQDTPKLEALFSSGEEFLKAQPGQQYVIGQMALAGANGAMGEFYKNLDKVKGYAETALKAFDSTTPPEGWKPDEWTPLRDLVLAQMNQYLGWQLIMPTKGDPNMALDYLAKAIQVRGKEGIGWKDPNNYFLRSTLYSNQYTELRKPYDAMTDEVKLSDDGKEHRKKLNEFLDTKLIPEYARVLAAASRPETKALADAIRPNFDAYWDYRTGAKDKAADYIKNYATDPTIGAVPIPAKAEDTSNLNAPSAPTTGPTNVKLSTGGAAAAGKGANSNGGKAAPAKKGSTRGRKRGRG
ncbi:MAG TPA: hypothetical protein VJ810_26185 [Blastocatellia bacterium]|nr:hypothetical protein [Blastocatellia bacterium]